MRSMNDLVRACSDCLLARPRAVPAQPEPAPPARPPPSSAAARSATCPHGTRYDTDHFHQFFGDSPPRRRSSNPLLSRYLLQLLYITGLL